MRLRRWATAATLSVAAVCMASLAFALAIDPPWGPVVRGEHPVGDFLGLSLLVVTYLTLGVVLVARRPDNPISWLLVGIALVEALNVLAGAVADRTTAGGSLAHDLATWYGTWSFAASVGGLLVLFHLFPTGRPVPSRWRLGTYIVFLGVSLSLVPSVQSGESDGIGLTGTPWLHTLLVGALAVSWLVGLTTAVPVLVSRFRRSVDAERQQIKWFLFCLVAGVVLWMLGGGWFLLGYTALMLPGIGVGIALLRYRLYDIDRVISRTASYAVVTTVVLGVYALVVTGVSRLLPDSSSSLAVAVATLAAAALARPVLRRVRSVVDRRFDRTRYDQLHTVDEFGQRLRQLVHSDHVADNLLATVQVTLQPASAGLWLREER